MGVFLKPEDKSVEKNKSILCEKWKNTTIGTFSSIEKNNPDATIIDCGDQFCITPELVDSHSSCLARAMLLNTQ